MNDYAKDFYTYFADISNDIHFMLFFKFSKYTK